MSKRVFILAHQEARNRACEAIRQAPEGYAVAISEPSRTLDQNAAQWPILQAFSEQLQWPVNGSMVYMTPEEWKTVLSAAFKREMVHIAQGLEGGVVMLGMRTSKMSKREFSEWLEFLTATASMKGIVVYGDCHAKK